MTMSDAEEEGAEGMGEHSGERFGFSDLPGRITKRLTTLWLAWASITLRSTLSTLCPVMV